MHIMTAIGLGGAVTAAETLGAGLGIGLTALAAGSTVGFSAIIEYTNRKLSQKRLLEIYREEIAALNGKSPDALTIDDLDTPASRSNPALDDAMKLFDRRRNFYVGTHAVAALALTGVVGLAVFALELVPALAIAGVAGLLYEQTFQSMKTLGNALFQVESARTITKQIREIADQIGLGGRVSSTRVLGVFIEANPELRGKVKERFGNEYAELTIAQKRDMVKLFDSTYQLYKITHDLNTGAVNPTELAFLAYGQKSGVPRRDAPLPFEETKMQESADMVCYSRNPQVRETPAAGPDHFQRMLRTQDDKDFAPGLKNLH